MKYERLLTLMGSGFLLKIHKIACNKCYLFAREQHAKDLTCCIIQ